MSESTCTLLAMVVCLAWAAALAFDMALRALFIEIVAECSGAVSPNVVRASLVSEEALDSFGGVRCCV